MYKYLGYAIWHTPGEMTDAVSGVAVGFNSDGNGPVVKPEQSIVALSPLNPSCQPSFWYSKFSLQFSKALSLSILKFNTIWEPLSTFSFIAFLLL